MQSSCLMPNITSKERISVWDAVSVYIQEHLQLRQGVRIPALGSFDVVPRWVKDGNETVIFLMPTFRLARNLVITHNLTDEKEYLPGHKELEPLKVAEVAANACMSQQRAENCMRGTTSLISRCLGKGENIALVLKDVGVPSAHQDLSGWSSRPTSSSWGGQPSRALGSSTTKCLGQAEDICHLHAPPLQIPHLMDMVGSDGADGGIQTTSASHRGLDLFAGRAHFPERSLGTGPLWPCEKG
ncbi:coiled-coil domain-containing protein 81-like [Anser cygnoides]|uniref:coiled-coil domain-containing protein 81-like n=1 Tax=Anser cygnoides TaxID=8845 RepID=UPI0034D2C329